jgi:hypothetical protein
MLRVKVKVNLSLVLLSCVPFKRERVEILLHIFLTSALDGDEWLSSYVFTKKERTWYSLDRRLGGPQDQSKCYGKEKILPIGN